jgi:putative ABC transport system permease protein
MNALIHRTEQIVQDLRCTVRALARAPGFAAVAVGVMALGIGLNVVGFGSINALWLRPLPFPDAHQLVGIAECYGGSSQGTAASLANFFDWQDRQKTFRALAAYQPTRVSLTSEGETDSVEALAATVDLFAVLGVAPAAGRTFVADDAQPGAPPVVVLSDNLWRRRYQGALLVGSTVKVDGVSSTVIGIMPPGFGFPDRTQLWLPLAVNRATLNRAAGNVWAVARLREGRTLPDARAEMRVIGNQLAREYPEAVGKLEPLLMPLPHMLVETDIRLAVLLSMAGAGFVLLIGCLNLANLFLARGCSRSREMAVRSALGASRGRLVRQLLAESLLLAVGGTAIGLVLGRAGLDAVVASLPEMPPLWLKLDIDATVLAFAVLLMLVTAVGVGLVPALRASKPDLREDLSESGALAGSGHASRAHRTLVVVEMAMALVLLVCTGLMTRAFLTMFLAEPGFRAEHRITMRVSPPRATYSSPESLRHFHSSLLDAIRQIPGVQAAAAGTRLPSQQANWVPAVIPENTVAHSPSGRFSAHAVVVTPGYFESLGIRLRQGRTFTAGDDRLDTVASVVINRTFAEQHWPTGDPIGRRLKLWLGPTNQSDWFTVVGVVDDVLSGRNNAPITTYFPSEQVPVRDLTLIVKGAADPAPFVPAIRRELSRLDSGVPLSEIRTMEAVLDEWLWQPRFFMRLFGASGLLALVLAAVGIYGVMAYGISRRTREIGIRAALGATQGRLVRLVLRQGLVSALVGIALGLALSLVATRALRSLLLGVSPLDPLSYIVMTGVLLAAAMLACYLPARRASRVDPLVALRYE